MRDQVNSGSARGSRAVSGGSPETSGTWAPTVTYSRRAAASGTPAACAPACEGLPQNPAGNELLVVKKLEEGW
jgi:hypothetical protein